MPHPTTDGYHGHSRDDLLAQVPALPKVSRVLELGCGEGRLGERLAALGHEVHGVEFVPAAAAIAARRLHRVHCGDVESLPLDYPIGHFALLVCGDVLEHLRDPWALLARVRPLLTADAHVVVSVPNVQYFPVVLGLLRGRFTYRDSGVLDRTHLRFFTRHEARRLLETSGYEVLAMPAVYPFRSALLRALAKALSAVTFGWLGGFLLGQIRVVGRPRPDAVGATTAGPP